MQPGAAAPPPLPPKKPVSGRVGPQQPAPPQGAAASAQQHTPGQVDDPQATDEIVSVAEFELEPEEGAGAAGGEDSTARKRKVDLLVLGHPTFVRMVKKFEDAQESPGDSVFTKARKAFQRDSKGYRENKAAIAGILGLRTPVSAQDIKTVLAQLGEARAEDEAAAAEQAAGGTSGRRRPGGGDGGPAASGDHQPGHQPPAPPASAPGAGTGPTSGAAGGAGGGRRPPGGGRQPPAPPIGAPLTAAALRPDVSGLTLEGADLFDLGADLFQLMQLPSASIHSPGEFIRTDLLGGRRYGNIFPPRATAVSVDAGGGNMLPVHANHLDDRTIAAQGPMTHEANSDGIPAFFATVLDQGITNIVNLTNEADGRGARNALAVQYWPSVGDTVVHVLSGGRSIEVTNNGTQQGPGYIIVNLTVDDLTGSGSKQVNLYQFTGWPDHGVPRGPQLAQFMSFVNLFDRQAGDSKTMVHCKAGVGRTGTFIVLRQLLSGIRAGQITRNNLLERIRDFVWEGRVARGPAFVQSVPQMVMLIEQGLAELDRQDQGAAWAPGDPGHGPQDDDDDDLSAMGAVGGVGISDVVSPGGDMEPMSLSTVQDLLRMGAIATGAEKDTLVIDEAVWVSILNGLSLAELEELAMRPNSELASYGPRVLRPAQEIYWQRVEARFPGDVTGGATSVATVQTVEDFFPSGVTGEAVAQLITEGGIVNPDNRQELLITTGLWQEILGHLSADELKRLAMLSSSVLRPANGYGDSVVDPVYRRYAELRVAEERQRRGGLAGVTAFLATNPNYRTGTKLGNAAWAVLTEMTTAERAAEAQGSARDAQQ